MHTTKRILLQVLWQFDFIYYRIYFLFVEHFGGLMTFLRENEKGQNIEVIAHKTARDEFEKFG